MKRTQIVIICILCFSCKKEQVDPAVIKNITPPDSCKISDLIRTNYTNDAKYVLFNEIIRDSSAHPDYNSPNFDTLKIDSILLAIQSVYNLHSPQTDSIFNFYHIHYHSYPDFEQLSTLILIPDTTQPEARKIIQQQPTNNALFDQLISDYGFDSVHAIIYPGFLWWIDIRTSRKLNTIPIANQLRTIPFIKEVDIARIPGDGNYISIKRKTDGWEIEFSYGYGDCPSGCTERTGWVFLVKNCKAELVRSYY